MPTERRQIIFSLEEMADALRSSHRSKGRSLFSSDVVAVTVKDTQVLVMLKGAGDGGRDPEEQTVEPSVVLDALVRYCLESNIPLPKAGRKQVLVSKSGVALLVILSDPSFDWLPILQLNSNLAV